MTPQIALSLILSGQYDSDSVVCSNSKYSNYQMRVYPFTIFWTKFANGSIRLNHILKDNTKVGSMPRVHYQVNRKIGTGIVYWNPNWQSIDDADDFDITNGDIGQLTVLLTSSDLQ